MPTTKQPMPRGRNTASEEQDMVLNHVPLQVQGKSQRECWANFGAAFRTREGRAFLQPGQFLPVWQRANSRRWQLKTPFELIVVSAFVMSGRYMIRGGNEKISSHPEILDWEDGIPVSGQPSELRFPGGVRRIRPSNTPLLMGNASNFEVKGITAKAFHDNFSTCSLHTGCPVELVCRCDKTSDTELPLAAHVVFDVVRGEATSGYVLPLPTVTSNEEEVVLKSYPEGWQKAVIQMLDTFNVQEIGVMYKATGEDIVEDISDDRPYEVYRNVINKDDLGLCTLDQALYERMLPFATGTFDPDMLGS